jgi:hypothetical protein
VDTIVIVASRLSINRNRDSKLLEIMFFRVVVECLLKILNSVPLPSVLLDFYLH